MKKCMLSLLGIMVISLSSFAQSFEGQVSYKIEVKGENAALMAMLMPNSMDMFMLGKDALIRMNGGIANTGDIITKGEEGKSYMVVHSKKTVYNMSSDKSKSTSKPTVEEKGTETIKGYKCTKYLVKFPKTEKGEIYQYMWCSTDIKFTPPQTAGKSSQFFLEEIKGFPVKIDQYVTASAKGQTMTINQELLLDKISETKPDAGMFEIPKKYKVEEFDETKMMK